MHVNPLSVGQQHCMCAFIMHVCVCVCIVEPLYTLLMTESV